MRSRRFTASTTAAVAVDGQEGSAAVPQRAIVKVPSGGSSVYAGGADVTAGGGGNGFEVVDGSPLSVDLINEDLYLVVSAGTQEVEILERFSSA